MSKKKRTTFGEISLDFFASCSAAALSKTVVAPVERLKLIYQVQNIHPSTKSQHYKNALDFFIRIPREQGVLSFWRGNLANVLRYLPYQSLTFTSNNQYKKLFGKPSSKIQSLCFSMSAGGLAGATSLTVVYPLDFVRTRMAVDTGRDINQREFRSLSDCFKKTYRLQGFLGYYSGYTAGITFTVLYRSCYFGFYEFIKRMHSVDPHDINIFLRFCIAEGVSVGSQTLCYPFDTVRRRMMMQNAVGKQIYKSTFECWSRVYNGEGLKGFYPGLSVNAVRSVGAALMLTIYDEIINLFEKNKQNKT